MAKESDLGITADKEKDFSEWFTQLMDKAELADTRYNVKGLPVYRHWAVRSMRKMYRLFEDALDTKGHEPLIFPALIPEKNFYLEKEHVEGFTPEVFWVTEHGNGEKLEEKLALRPTSETAFYFMYSKWIRSHNDLPFKRYQSCQVWRYEGKATRPFFRTREIHWIEAHDAFATEEEARKQVLEDMETTKEVLYEQLAIPHIFFQRPEWDKFAGAVHTYAADALMGSGKVLQLPSTHLLGQNFSKPFDVKFMDKDGKEKYVYITCYGPAISRNYGALIALHGDNKGLILPFAVAPVHIVIVPIFYKDSETKVMKKCKEIQKKLKGYEIRLDNRDHNPGYKFNEWEMKGVPIRIDIGPKDVESKSITLYRRDFGTKKTIPEKELLKTVATIQQEFTENLKKRTTKEFEQSIVFVSEKAKIKTVLDNNKIAKANFCTIEKAGEACAGYIEKECLGLVRGKRVDEEEQPQGNCLVCGKKASVVVYIARSY